jgi:hypothetical protein
VSSLHLVPTQWGCIAPRRICLELALDQTLLNVAQATCSNLWLLPLVPHHSSSQFDR